MGQSASPGLEVAHTEHSFSTTQEEAKDHFRDAEQREHALPRSVHVRIEWSQKMLAQIFKAPGGSKYMAPVSSFPFPFCMVRLYSSSELDAWSLSAKK